MHYRQLYIKIYNEKMGKCSFFILNFILSSNIFKIPVIVFYFLVMLPSMIDNSLPNIEILSFGIAILLFIMVLFFKIFVFIFLAKRVNKSTYIYNFFRKFANDKIFRVKVFIFSIVLDILCIISEAAFWGLEALMHPNQTFSIVDNIPIVILLNLAVGGGVFVSYLALYLWLNDYKRCQIFGEKEK